MCDIKRKRIDEGIASNKNKQSHKGGFVNVALNKRITIQHAEYDVILVN